MQRIFISGCSRGIGLALTEHYLASGRNVIGCSRTPTELSVDVQDGRFQHHFVDITDERAVGAMMSTIRRSVGGFGTLINNAGASSAQVGMLAKAESLERVLATNVVGNFIVTRDSLRMMRAAGFGRVINISSIAVPLEETGNSFYAASKSALTRITHQMARELKGANITVNTVGVSFFEEGSMFTELGQGAVERYRRRLVDPSPISIAELAYAIDFFAGDETGRITGQTIYFGGPV